jgi:Ser/Thr protein kinase RdoA (MazF antagonist)
MRPRVARLLDASHLANQYFQHANGSFHAEMELPSYSDQNFLLCLDLEKYVLKINNSDDKLELLEAQNQAMLHVMEAGVTCQEPLPSIFGSFACLVELPSVVDPHKTTSHIARLFKFIPGVLLGHKKQEREGQGDIFISIGKLRAELMHLL